MKYLAIFTAILSLYLLSFGFLSKSVFLPALMFAIFGLLFFPIYFFIGKLLRYGFPQRNLFLPLDIALIIAILTNIAGIGSPPFFAVMFLVQVVMLPFALIWCAYEFYKEGLILPFAVSFVLWGGLVFVVGSLI